MIYNNIEFHNIAELKEISGTNGKRLQRVQEEVRIKLNEEAQERMLAMAGSEIRFISQGSTVKIHLNSEIGCEIIPFWGMFQGNQRIQIKGDKTIKLSYPERLSNYDLGKFKQPFSHEVWRLVMRGGPVYFKGIEGTGIRPPREDEIPDKKYLAYGTSITHGAASTGIHLAYVSQTARRLGVDLCNLGVGGSAFCEPELANLIAEREDWDFATLSLSVNMVGGFSVEEFRDRVSYMINKVGGSSRPVFCITIFPHFRDLNTKKVNNNVELAKRTVSFRKVLKEEVDKSEKDNLYLINGSDLLKEFGGLSIDLIHPADNGMIQMGENLASKVTEIIDISSGRDNNGSEY